MALLIHQVAKEVNIHIDTIKRAEKRGLISSQRDVNNWRHYSPDTVEILKRLYMRDNQSPESDGLEPKQAT